MLRGLLSTFFNAFGQRDNKGYVGFLGCEIVKKYREGVSIVFPKKRIVSSRCAPFYPVVNLSARPHFRILLVQSCF